MRITKKQKKEFLKNKLTTSQRWASKALLKIYANQTADEQLLGTTTKDNGIGFSGVDGEILSSFAKQLIEKGYLSQKQYAILFKKMGKYWGQILQISDQQQLEQLITRG